MTYSHDHKTFRLYLVSIFLKYIHTRKNLLNIVAGSFNWLVIFWSYSFFFLIYKNVGSLLCKELVSNGFSFKSLEKFSKTQNLHVLIDRVILKYSKGRRLNQN